MIDPIDIPIGYKFYVSEKFIRDIDYNTVRWVVVPKEYTVVISLGYTNVFDGEINSGGYDHDTGYAEPPSFFQTKTHRVLVVQPIQGKRYRKPFYVLSPFQNHGYWSTAESSTKEKQIEDNKRLEGRLKSIKDTLEVK
jgi:hypothetical protein